MRACGREEFRGCGSYNATRYMLHGGYISGMCGANLFSRRGRGLLAPIDGGVKPDQPTEVISEDIIRSSNF